jgi:cellulose synthase/poly-beta-1,6-N-acetylglucosamine synthase-like glycosyltransferase
MPEVSVIIPLYGSHRARSVLPTVARAWLMQDVSCEVIVATPGRPTVDTMLDDFGAEPNVRVLAGDVAVTAPGLLRNLAAAHAAAPRLDLSDADIVPLGTDLLRRAIALAGADVVYQTWMHRLARPSARSTNFSPESPHDPCCSSVSCSWITKPAPTRVSVSDAPGNGAAVGQIRVRGRSSGCRRRPS